MTTSESKGRFFLQNESIRIDSHNESNRIDSNRELECSTVNVTLPAFAAERRAAAPLLLGAGAVDRRSAANPPHGAAGVERWDRQTDGLYPRPCYAGTAPDSASNLAETH